MDRKADAIVRCNSKAGQSVLIPLNAGHASVFKLNQNTLYKVFCSADKLNRPEKSKD